MHPSSTRPVVVGVNESPASLSAVRAAARQAMMYGRELRIVHACNWLPTYRPHPRRTADAILDQAVMVADDVAPGLRITTRMLEGAPATLLLRESRMAALMRPSQCGRRVMPSRSGCCSSEVSRPTSFSVSRGTPGSWSWVRGANGRTVAHRDR